MPTRMTTISWEMQGHRLPWESSSSSFICSSSLWLSSTSEHKKSRNAWIIIQKSRDLSTRPSLDIDGTTPVMYSSWPTSQSSSLRLLKFITWNTTLAELFQMQPVWFPSFSTSYSPSSQESNYTGISPISEEANILRIWGVSIGELTRPANLEYFW